MVIGGLRRCEVLGLRTHDLRVAERRVFIAEGKGGHQRLVPLSARFFTALAAYFETERPAGALTDRVFVVLKGPNRGNPLSVRGLDDLLAAAKRRAGLTHAQTHHRGSARLSRRSAQSALEWRQGDGLGRPLDQRRLGRRGRPGDRGAVVGGS